jgi:hypothetical protein
MGALGFSTAALFAGPVGPVPYLSANDSPFKSVDFSAGYFHLEDFEDGQLNVPGVTASAGAPFGPGSITDSVDADDGAIDGSGTGGNSFFSGAGSSGISFTFDNATLGSLPTHAGLVWTDSGVGATITFQAFDAADQLLGTIGPSSEPGVFPDNNNSGGTAEDRFFGWTDSAGIGRIFISNSTGGIEVDHLQYGSGTASQPPPPPTGIPLPAPIWGGILLLGAAGACYRKARARLE